MTYPNHTDTSRSGELEKCFNLGDCAWTVRQAVRGYVVRHLALIEALEARVAELEDVAGDLLTRFEPWSPHDHDAAKRARAALGKKQ